MNFKTTNIKGKEYVQVNERIKYFRTSPEYAGYSLLSEIVAFDDAHCIVKATITNEQGKPVANGLAHEVKTSSMINKTSMLENCETSAWGRALGNLGIGIDTSIATAEEADHAINTQNAPANQTVAPPPPEKKKQTPAEYIAKFIGKVSDAEAELVNTDRSANGEESAVLLLHSLIKAKKQ
jgi:hypothetical protein